MEFLELAKLRYSCRKFNDKKIEEEKVRKIIEAGMVAPTACNKQPQVIYCIKSKEGLERLQKCKYQHFNEQLAFLVCYDKTKCWVRDFDEKISGENDASIVATHMMLEATDLEIGSTWIMHFMPDTVCEEFQLSENIIPVCILAMGYEESYRPSDLHCIRKKVEEVVIEK